MTSGPVDRPPFEAVLALKVRRSFKDCFGAIELVDRLFLEAKMGARPSSELREVLLDIAGDLSSPPGSSALLDLRDQFLCKHPALFVPFLPPGVGEINVYGS